MPLSHPKRALVTGASGDIGSAIATRLAADGMHVVVHANSNLARAQELVDAIHHEGGSAEAVAFDVTDHQAASHAIDALLEHGPLQVLVNNAGVFAVKSTGEFTLEDYEWQMGVNARAVFAAIQRAAPLLRDGGRIINIGSSL
ncbi:SDR family NAD(P)-dependent oxidoreductase, partial [Bacillus tequilensis]|nr:SDR family NAD(P)-dependent oxidoreductase [Bacillus tequilensis]